jgi:hypothetical protein
MKLFLDLNGTLLDWDEVTKQEILSVENMTFIKRICKNEKIESVTFLSMSLATKFQAYQFLREWGESISTELGVPERILKCEPSALIRGIFKRDMFLNASDNFGHSIFFDDSLRKQYECIETKKFKKEMFRVEDAYFSKIVVGKELDWMG